MKYKYIVFDVDGTLIDSSSYFFRSLNKAIGSDSNISNNSLFGLTSHEALKKIGVDDINNFAKKWESELQKLENSLELFDGMRETLVVLKIAGYSLGIVTSMYGAPLRRRLTDINIINLFDIIVSADMTSYHKPDPEPLEKFIELADVSNRDILYIGDSSADYYCAKSADVDFVEAKWGSYGRLDSIFDVDMPTDLLKFLI